MGTRATVKVEGVRHCKLYKHWDGYPEMMLPWLEEFNKAFTKERGDDPEYKLAQLLRDSVRSADKFNLDDSTTTGYGITSFFDNCGEEFVYTLHKDGTVSVFEVSGKFLSDYHYYVQ